MENNKIKVSVFVAGQRFTILTEKSEKYVLDIASRIDARINSLVVSGDMTRERAAVLTALDFADDNETDKENINAVKEQMKDYLQEIERLQDDRAKISADYQKLKEEYERLVADQRDAENLKNALSQAQKQIDALTAENQKLKEENKALSEKQSSDENMEKELAEYELKVSALLEEIDWLRDQLDEKEESADAADETEKKEITAEDDLFFDEEETVKPKPQKKKNRHEHSHVNPYQQKAAEKKQKGYTQQRQYTFFDIDEED